MRRVYLPLLPVPILALVVGFSACSGSGDPVPHVIPPAAPYQPSNAAALPSSAPQPGLAAASLAAAPAPAPSASAPQADDVPSEEEVRAFHRPVPK